MKQEITLAGFGGQGILFTGQLLGRAGMLEEKNVCYVPSYGPEMRGGMSSCSVIISGSNITCPLVTEPSSAIAFNHASAEQLEQALKPGGILIINSSLTDKEPQRKDIKFYKITASDRAVKLGNDRVANMVLLGALVKITGILKPDSLIKVLESILPERKHHLLPVNKMALEEGISAVEALEI